MPYWALSLAKSRSSPFRGPSPMSRTAHQSNTPLPHTPFLIAHISSVLLNRQQPRWPLFIQHAALLVAPLRDSGLFSCNNARNPICACVSMTPGEGARPGSPRCLAKQRERAAPLTRSKQPPRERLASRGRSLHAWPRAQAARTTLPSPKNHPASAAAVPRPCALAMPRRPSGRQRPLAPVVVLGTELNTATSRARCVIKMRCKDHVVSKSCSFPLLN